MNVRIHNRQMSVRVLLAFVILLMQSCGMASEQEEFAAAKQQNTLEALDAFLKIYPTGQYSFAAKETFDSLLFQKAANVSSDAHALETIFRRCKTSAVADKVFKMWDGATWNNANTQNLPSSYRGYLARFPGGEHVEEAKVKIEDLNWRICQQNGTKESCEQYVKDSPEGKHADEARKVLDHLAYQQAKEKNTIEAYEKFLKDHSGHKAADKQLRQLRYERALRTRTLEDWKSFYDQYSNSFWDDDGKVYEQMKKNADKEIERLLFERIVRQPTLEMCQDYLDRYSDDNQRAKDGMFKCFVPGRYRDAIHKQQVIVKMEPFLFAEAVQANKLETYFDYIALYPKGYRNVEIRNKMDPILFMKAQEEDWYSTYKEYITQCPNGKSVQKARDRIAYLKANKALVEIEYPKVLEQSGNNESRLFWSWKTLFREKGGKVGFRVSGSGYIHDLQGGSWGSNGSSINRQEMKVPAGGTGNDDYWCSSEDHVFCNGYAIFTWTGEDAGGHPVSLRERVKLQHTGCPGHKK